MNLKAITKMYLFVVVTQGSCDTMEKQTLAFFKTEHDSVGAHSMWQRTYENLGEQFTNANSPFYSKQYCLENTVVHRDHIRTPAELHDAIKSLDDNSVTLMVISEHGDEAGLTSLLGSENDLNILSSILRKKLGTNAKVFLDSCFTGKAQSGSATKLSKNLYHGQFVLATPKSLPVGAIEFKVTSPRGDKTEIFISTPFKQRDDALRENYNHLWEMFPDLMDYILPQPDETRLTPEEVSLILENILPNIYNNVQDVTGKSVAEFIAISRDLVQPLEIQQYEGEMKRDNQKPRLV